MNLSCNTERDIKRSLSRVRKAEAHSRVDMKLGIRTSDKRMNKMHLVNSGDRPDIHATGIHAMNGM
jgi:hypothetical protein